MRRVHIVAEGPTDVAVIGRVLRAHGLEEKFRRADVESLADGYFRRLCVPPQRAGDDLRARTPVPRFWASESHAVAVLGAIGVERLVDSLQESIAVLGAPLDTWILIGDADADPDGRFAQIRDRLRERGLPVPDAPAEPKRDQSTDFGVWLMPQPGAPGAVDDFVAAAGAPVYERALAWAEAQVQHALDNANPLELDRRVLKELRKHGTRVKARLALVANVLRPGKSIQVSIDDNEWLGQQGMQTPMVAKFVDFIRCVGAIP